MSRSRVCLPLLLLCLLCADRAAGQSGADDYYPYAEPEERVTRLLTDSALFYRAVQQAPDLYDRIAGFALPQVAVKRRGQPFAAEAASVGGVALPYRYFSVVRLLGAEEEARPGLASAVQTAGGAGGVREFRFGDDMPLLPFYASVRLTDRNYRVGAQLAAVGELGRGWRGAAALDARTGRDLHVEGVFTNALTAGFRLAKSFGRGELALLAAVPLSARGTRLSSVGEAFALTGDRLYNPAWGFQNGKVRNARVRREAVPLAVAVWGMPLSAATTLRASFGAEAGERSYSGLGWYDARTPMPDNYRCLLSYTGDRETERVWRERDPRFTQIDWDALIARNRMAGGEAVYALEERAERLCNLRAAVGFITEPDPRLTLRYGVDFDHLATRRFKRMRDLLGADHIVDIDQYLVDDDTYGNRLQNDLRHPGRVVREGDRFGYDYTLTVRELRVRLRAEYRSDRFRADLAAMFGDAVVCRRGHYEKELFPGEGSFGSSRRMRFTPYTLKLSAGWSFSPRSYIGAAALVAAALPEAEHLFLQPQYNNRTVDDPVPERIYGAEATFRLTGSAVELQAAAFATATFDAIRTVRYYDDLAGVYADLAQTGIGTLALGAEIAAQFRLSYRWQLSLAASAGRYRYVRDPRITVLSDVDNTPVDRDAASHMGGCRLGGAPQWTGCGELSYFGPKGWGFRLSAGFAGGRYVEPQALRRTERLARQAGLTPEAFDAFTVQERLHDAWTVDAALFKTFYLGRSRLAAALMLRNLTGENDAAYGGWESLRVRRLRAGDGTYYEPQATRYTYIYPRSFFLTISYRF